MTFKEAESIIKSELMEIYPVSETEAMIQVIFNHFFSLSRFQRYLNANSVISEKSGFQIYNIIHQLKEHKPLQYILGETEFYGLRFLVNEQVLIPRPETEELVQWVINDWLGKTPCTILDVGTGSGCIAISLSKNLPDASVSAIDISIDAINTAKRNALINEAAVNFKICDILHPNVDEFSMFDILVSNPPYVTAEQKAEMLPNVLDYEPHIALFAPVENPFIFYEAIALFAKQRLKPNGYLYFEINEKYPQETAQCIEKYGFTAELKRDINNKYRMIKARHHG
jgi:release factor glutamine methyltransferase